MGGIHFFHVALESCEGDWELVEEAMQGANAPAEGEERKGGAGEIGKAFLSAGACARERCTANGGHAR